MPRCRPILQNSRPRPLEHGQQDEEYPAGRDGRVTEQAARRRLTLGIDADDLGAVLEGELDLGQPPVDVLGDRSEVAPGHLGPDVEAPDAAFVADEVRRRPQGL